MMSGSPAKRVAAAVCGCAVLLSTASATVGQVPYGANYSDQSDYALGTYVWNIVFMESSSNPWGASALQTRKNRIQNAATFWENKANKPGRFLPDIDWLNITVNFANGGDPVTMDNVGGEGDYSYYDEALGLLDPSYDTGGAYTASKTYNDAMREQFGTNWSFTTFVRNFSGRASAFLNGPFTNAYIDDPTGTYSHEVGHIFGARDEYRDGTNHNTGQRSGYLYTYNTNAAVHPDGSNNASYFTALMNSSYSTVLSSGTINAIGWQDTDNDLVPDILDTFPTLSNLSISSPTTGSVDIDLDAVVTPMPSPNPECGDFTINNLDSAEYRLNGGNWMSLGHVESGWGEYEESLSFTVAGLTDPINDLELRVRNSVTNFSTMQFTLSPNGELPGDANRDGVTDALDFGIWEANYGETELASWDTADFDLNGRVDGRDYLILQQSVGLDFLTESTGRGAAPDPGQLIAAVPEPSSLALVGLSVASGLVRRRRV